MSHLNPANIFETSYDQIRQVLLYYEVRLSHNMYVLHINKHKYIVHLFLFFKVFNETNLDVQ